MFVVLGASYTGWCRLVRVCALVGTLCYTTLLRPTHLVPPVSGVVKHFASLDVCLRTGLHRVLEIGKRVQPLLWVEGVHGARVKAQEAEPRAGL